MDKAPNAPRGNLVGAGWPSFRYYPGGVAQVFQRPEDVPEGWQDTPEKAKAYVAPPVPEPVSLKKTPETKPISVKAVKPKLSAFPAPNLDDLE